MDTIKSKTILTIVLMVIVFVACYVVIYHVHRVVVFMPIIIAAMGGCCILLSNIWSRSFKSAKRNIKRAQSILFVMLVTMTLCIWGLYNTFIKIQLSEHGVYTTAKVIRLYKERNKYRINGLSYAEIMYVINNDSWFDKVGNKKLNLKVGDHLEIICSSEDPRIFKIK